MNLTRRSKQALAGAALAATMLTPAARAQSFAASEPATSAYTHTFHAVPQDAFCTVDVVGINAGSNPAKISAVTPTNDAIETAKDYDLSSGKAVREDLRIVFGEYRAKIGSVKVESAQPSKASITCISKISDKTKMPDGTEVDWPVLSGYTLPSAEFNSQEILFVPQLKNPFSKPDAPVAWKNAVVAQNASDSNGYLELKTQQLNPSATKDNEHFSWQPLVRGESKQFTIDDLFASHIRQNSVNGTMRIVRADGTRTPDLAAYQLIKSEDGGQAALAMPNEMAARELYFTHAFSPAPGQDLMANWAISMSLANPNAKSTSVYVTPFDASGKELGTNVITLGAGKTLTSLPKDLFAGIKDYQNVASVRVTSKERIHGAQFFKYDNQLVAVPAATSLDLGTELLAPRAFFSASGAVSSFAVFNPGARAEPVKATAYDAQGKEVAAREFTIAPRTKAAGGIHDFFPEKDLSSVAYVKFKTTQAPKDASVLDQHNPEGRIAGMAINADWRFGLQVTGYKLENIDANRILIETSKYNPRPITGTTGTTTRDVAELEDTPGEITATVISNQPVTGVTYDFGNGQGFSATIMNERQGRMLHATKKSADGFEYKYFPNQVQGTSVTYMPTIGISTLADGKTQLSTYKTNMTVVDRLPVFNVNALNGPGFARNVTREQAPQIAKILTTERGTILGGTLPLVDKDGNLLMSEQTLSDDLQQKASISGPDSLANIHIIDKKQFNSYILETADGARADIAIPKTGSGNDLVQQLKNIYQVGPKWYHMLAEGTTLTLK